jgi:hypothetical protein
MRSKMGLIILHGPHHVAQKSITVTLSDAIWRERCQHRRGGAWQALTRTSCWNSEWLLSFWTDMLAAEAVKVRESGVRVVVRREVRRAEASMRCVVEEKEAGKRGGACAF